MNLSCFCSIFFQTLTLPAAFDKQFFDCCFQLQYNLVFYYLIRFRFQLLSLNVLLNEVELRLFSFVLLLLHLFFYINLISSSVRPWSCSPLRTVFMFINSTSTSSCDLSSLCMFYSSFLALLISLLPCSFSEFYSPPFVRITLVWSASLCSVMSYYPISLQIFIIWFLYPLFVGLLW